MFSVLKKGENGNSKVDLVAAVESEEDQPRRRRQGETKEQVRVGDVEDSDDSDDDDSEDDGGRGEVRTSVRMNSCRLGRAHLTCTGLEGIEIATFFWSKKASIIGKKPGDVTNASSMHSFGSGLA